jgi:hypothetical protein
MRFLFDGHKCQRERTSIGAYSGLCWEPRKRKTTWYVEQGSPGYQR